MPLYEYLCKKCGHKTELIQNHGSRPLRTCPDCGGSVKKMISAPAIQFKGSGFYITDYGKGDIGGSSKKGEGSGEKSSGGSESDSSSGKADAKADSSAKSDSSPKSESTSSSSPAKSDSSTGSNSSSRSDSASQRGSSGKPEAKKPGKKKG